MSPALVTVSFALASLTTLANNISITNTTLTGSTGTTVQVQFDLSWSNSWRGGGVTNWDAAWVFVKFRTSATGTWRHAYLNNTGHVAAAGSQIDLGLLTPGTAWSPDDNPAVGVFVYRNASGNGTLSLPATQLRWDFAAQGLNYNDIIQLQVFAIEMVYMPRATFAVGSGGTEISCFPLTTINTANATAAPSGAGALGGAAGGYPTGQPAPSSASWPNGFSAAYCMKYEVSQQGYVDFLNTLTYAQQVTRTQNSPLSAAGTGAMSNSNPRRNGIVIQTPGVAVSAPALYACNLNGNTSYGEATDGKEIACNWLSWGDLSAYLDWSGLRPMTELEFEKACRGGVEPLANGYPWGTTTLVSGTYTLSNAGANNEGIASSYSSTSGNATYVSFAGSGAAAGPVRAGIFAANAGNTGRVTAGASYYGIMELGGNVCERTITYGGAGAAFTGSHGNGMINVDGQSDPASWPPASADGAGIRGGSWQAAANQLRISDRLTIGYFDDFRDQNYGGRGVRSAP